MSDPCKVRAKMERFSSGTGRVLVIKDGVEITTIIFSMRIFMGTFWIGRDRKNAISLMEETLTLRWPSAVLVRPHLLHKRTVYGIIAGFPSFLLSIAGLVKRVALNPIGAAAVPDLTLSQEIHYGQLRSLRRKNELVGDATDTFTGLDWPNSFDSFASAADFVWFPSRVSLVCCTTTPE